MSKLHSRAFTLVEIMIVVVIIGILASIAVPAFNKVRQQTRKNAVLENLRQIASVGQQVILDQGVDGAAYLNLVADGYMPRVKPVGQESYDFLIVREGGGSLRVDVDDGLTVQYDY